MMPVSIAGDLSIGHAGFTPSPITPMGAAAARVLVLNVPPHVIGDLIGIHVLGTSAHIGTVQQTSTTVLVGGIGVCRLMDKGNCGAMILGTAATVIAGG